MSVDEEGEPTLLRADGSTVDTWREGYPYPERLRRADYEREKRQLQIELLKLQNWVKESGEKAVILLEGRDAAGKGGDDKQRARLAAMRHVLHRFPYDGKDDEVVGVPDPLVVGSATEVLETAPLFPRL